MANKVITLEPMYRGDTSVFGLSFTAPSSDFSWGNVLLDVAMTNAAAPNDNSQAGAVRVDQVLTVATGNVASYDFQLTFAESKALAPGATYMIQAQLKENGTNVTTPTTAKIQVLQDYVI